MLPTKNPAISIPHTITASVFAVMQHSSVRVADAVRRTIEELEKTAPDELKVDVLKHRAVLRFAELQEPSKPAFKDSVVNPTQERE